MPSQEGETASQTQIIIDRWDMAQSSQNFTFFFFLKKKLEILIFENSWILRLQLKTSKQNPPKPKNIRLQDNSNSEFSECWPAGGFCFLLCILYLTSFLPLVYVSFFSVCFLSYLIYNILLYIMLSSYVTLNPTQDPAEYK